MPSKPSHHCAFAYCRVCPDAAMQTASARPELWKHCSPPSLIQGTLHGSLALTGAQQAYFGLAPTCSQQQYPHSSADKLARYIGECYL